MTKIVMMTRYIQVDIRGSSVQIIVMVLGSDDRDDDNDDDNDDDKGDEKVETSGHEGVLRLA